MTHEPGTGLVIPIQYFALCRRDKGAVLVLVRKVTGCSRAQLTRLVAQWLRLENRIPWQRRQGPLQLGHCSVELRTRTQSIRRSNHRLDMPAGVRV